MTALRTGWPRRGLRDLLEAAQDHRGDFLRRVLAVAQLDLFVPSHPPLDRPDGALGVEQVLVARLLADQQRAIVRDADDRRQDHPAGIVGQHLGAPVTV